jgi:hypothetical protein
MSSPPLCDLNINGTRKKCCQGISSSACPCCLQNGNDSLVGLTWNQMFLLSRDVMRNAPAFRRSTIWYSLCDRYGSQTFLMNWNNENQNKRAGFLPRVSYKFLLGSFSTWFPQDSCIKFPKRPQVGSAHPLSGNYAPFFFLNSSLGKRQIACYMPCPFSWRIQSWIAKRTILVGTLMQKHAKAIGVMPASQIVSHPNSCWIMIAKGNHPANCSSVG